MKTKLEGPRGNRFRTERSYHGILAWILLTKTVALYLSVVTLPSLGEPNSPRDPVLAGEGESFCL